MYYNDLFLECVCNQLGTNASAGVCDRNSGQCPCLPHVIGLQCDQCEPNYWKIASGTGCEPCGCDPLGSVKDQCNEVNPVLKKKQICLISFLTFSVYRRMWMSGRIWW